MVLTLFTEKGTIVKNNKGFGLVETLIASAIGLTLVLALAKTSTGQYNFYKAVTSVFDEQDLSYSLGKVLTDDVSCKANLKPSRLNNGDMPALVQGLNNPDVADMTLIETGTNFKSLSIVKINLSGDGDPKTQAVSRELTVYFKRKGIKTKDNNPCSSADTSGCYTTKCLLKYQVENNFDPDKEVTLCDVQTCAGRAGNNLSGIQCSGGYLVGFDSQGQKVCKNLSDLWSCPAGQAIRGFILDPDTNKMKAVCGVSGLCGDNEVLKGYNPDGTQSCVALASSPTPPTTPPPRGSDCPAGYSTGCGMCRTSCPSYPRMSYWDDSVCGCKVVPGHCETNPDGFGCG